MNNDDVININNAKIVYNMFLKKYDLLDESIISNIINEGSDYNIIYIQFIFDINVYDNMYHISYGYHHCYKSYIKQDVITFAIQLFKVYKKMHNIYQYNLDYLKDCAIESEEEQFIQLFD